MVRTTNDAERLREEEENENNDGITNTAGEASIMEKGEEQEIRTTDDTFNITDVAGIAFKPITKGLSDIPDDT